MPYLLFLKKNSKILNCRLLQIIGGALRVNNNGYYLHIDSNTREKVIYLYLFMYRHLFSIED